MMHKNKFIRKFFLAFIILSMLVFPSNTTHAAVHLDDNPQVEKLFDQMRQNILLQDNNHNYRASVTKAIASELDSIETQLASYGITRISSDEVRDIVNSSQKSRVGINSIDIIQPDDGNGVKWYKSSITTVNIGGVNYETIYLRAVASDLDSPLVKQQSNIKYINREPFKILKTNIVKFVINKGINLGVQELAKELPIVGLGVKFYDAIKSIFSGVKTTDIIEEVTTSVTVRSCTDVKFVYVKQKNQSSAYQDLALTTTKMSTVTTFDSPVLLTDHNSTIDAIIGKVQINVSASDYDSSMYRAALYYSMGYRDQTNYVDLDVVIQDDKTIGIPTATPRYPIHLM